MVAAYTRFLCITLSVMLLVAGIAVRDGRCAEDWRADFDQACEKTTESMTLSLTELNSLIEKCTQLEKFLATQEETVRKVYLKRVQMCKKMYLFARDALMEKQQKQG